MTKESILYSIIGLLVGVVITGFVAGQAVNGNNTGMMQMMGMDTSRFNESDVTNHSMMSMKDMSGRLKNLSGDEYDKAFIEMMIAHHEGAVDMAKLSNSRAKHTEIKDLSTAIISAQEKEIADMKLWQQNWGYSSDEMMDMMHGGN